MHDNPEAYTIGEVHAALAQGVASPLLEAAVAGRMPAVLAEGRWHLGDSRGGVVINRLLVALREFQASLGVLHGEGRALSQEVRRPHTTVCGYLSGRSPAPPEFLAEVLDARPHWDARWLVSTLAEKRRGMAFVGRSAAGGSGPAWRP